MRKLLVMGILLSSLCGMSVVKCALLGGSGDSIGQHLFPIIKPGRFQRAEKKGRKGMRQGLRAKTEQGTIFFPIPRYIDLDELGLFFGNHTGFFAVISVNNIFEGRRLEYTIFQKKRVKGNKSQSIECVTLISPFGFLNNATAARMEVAETAAGKKFTIFTSGENGAAYKAPVLYAGEGASIERRFDVVDLHRPGYAQGLAAIAHQASEERKAIE